MYSQHRICRPMLNVFNICPDQTQLHFIEIIKISIDVLADFSLNSIQLLNRKKWLFSEIDKQIIPLSFFINIFSENR